MLNLDLIDALYKQLSKQQKQELISILFKKSRQSMSYFHRTKDISLSKLETMADFFHLTLDSFRVGNDMAPSIMKGYKYKAGDQKMLSTNPEITKLKAENDSLKSENKNLRLELERLKELNASNQQLLEAKQEVLNTKDQLIQLLTNSMATKAE